MHIIFNHTHNKAHPPEQPSLCVRTVGLLLLLHRSDFCHPWLLHSHPLQALCTHWGVYERSFLRVCVRVRVQIQNLALNPKTQVMCLDASTSCSRHPCIPAGLFVHLPPPTPKQIHEKACTSSYPFTAYTHIHIL